jgi:hypothetical protein
MARAERISTRERGTDGVVMVCGRRWRGDGFGGKGGSREEKRDVESKKDENWKET